MKLNILLWWFILYCQTNYSGLVYLSTKNITLKFCRCFFSYFIVSSFLARFGNDMFSPTTQRKSSAEPTNLRAPNKGWLHPSPGSTQFTKLFRYQKWRNPHLYKLYGYGLCKGKPNPKIAGYKVQETLHFRYLKFLVINGIVCMNISPGSRLGTMNQWCFLFGWWWNHYEKWVKLAKPSHKLWWPRISRVCL